MKQIVKYGLWVALPFFMLLVSGRVIKPEMQPALVSVVSEEKTDVLYAAPLALCDNDSGELVGDCSAPTSVEKYLFLCRDYYWTGTDKTVQIDLPVRFSAPFSLPDAAYIYGLHEIIV